ncbi:hypothetical protein CAI21_14560 [Alkalilimnicola ehrlichii]|uniref:Uncharacterized protein n=1 Tax=Alkalilimnicola ehrlichii TaxID=351052 RepID=A0A3E0WQX4_9GAMM|nr:hypothetical protein [Alkalilimnicola ehrlichii]RFA27263.1 hypothetical protein CAI21_14560 [Alkalilimnicola ehrlichii]RFA34375.1 hypothetical protein CAL65_15125 [Alkalilimnicola ehrlichii]
MTRITRVIGLSALLAVFPAWADGLGVTIRVLDDHAGEAEVMRELRLPAASENPGRERAGQRHPNDGGSGYGRKSEQRGVGVHSASGSARDSARERRDEARERQGRPPGQPGTSDSKPDHSGAGRPDHPGGQRPH